MVAIITRGPQDHITDVRTRSGMLIGWVYPAAALGQWIAARYADAMGRTSPYGIHTLRSYHGSQADAVAEICHNR